ncbi:hypothetical protein IMZ48_20035 [Candidatus Bathyarchaeota archaeon]|nr:hypothetical protein [Candidatus Bathyarchaeota archaeon]
MSDQNPPRPRLKINVSQAKVPQAADANATPNPPSTAALLTPGGHPRKIVFKGSQPPTPADRPRANTPTLNSKTKVGRQTKPTAKKREYDEFGDGDIMVEHQPKLKKRVVRLVNSKAPTNIVIKPPGRPPVRPPGEGYDSEASDREDDPLIEEQIVIRMMPGEHCEYIRKAVEENNFGPRRDGGANIRLVWLEDESRRAVLYVQGQAYAAVLVDLPTITEGMKTFDRKSCYKSTDICQMVLVFQAVANDKEAKTVPLPSAMEPGFKWPHGLTPPMHDAAKRRFAKVISRKEIEDKEAEVDRLLQLDASAQTSRWELVDDRQLKEVEDFVEYEEDAEGEEDDEYFRPQDNVEGTSVADLEADLEAAFEEAASTPATQMEGVTPMTATEATPAQVQETVEESEESVEDEDEDEDEDEESVDDEDNTRLDEVKGVRAMIADLKAQLKAKEEDLKKPTVAGSVILRKRVEDTIRTLKSEIQLKMSSIGEDEEEEED